MRIFDAEHTQPKRHVDGTHRARSPDETLRDYSRLMQQMGITRLADVTGLDYLGLPVFMAVRPNARCLAVSQGKGLDRASAATSALMESIESWHAERITLPLRLASIREMERSGDAIDVEQLPLTTRLQRPREVPICWVPGWDLLQERQVWVPEEAVGLNFVGLGRSAIRMFTRSSNGLSSGNHILEAMLHGLCEVIERDAITLWTLDDDERSKRTQVDLASVRDPGCRTYIDGIRAAGLTVGVWNLTSDLGVPSYLAVLADEPGLRSVGVHSGSGTHTAPAIAMLRALSESVQSRLTYIAGSRDDTLPHNYAAQRNADDVAAVREEIDGNREQQEFAAQPGVDTDSFEGDLARCLEALRRAGLGSAVVVDLSQRDIGVPVVKVLVPGLEEDDPEGLVPGRRAQAVMERR